MVRVAVFEFFSFVKRAASLSTAAPGREVPHHVTRFVVAGILLTASVLKFWSVASDGFLLATGTALTAALGALELIAAVVLLVRRPGTVLWTMYTLGFVVFACISAYHAWNGAPTCGCFGNMAVPPAWTLALDLAIVAALIAFPPAGWLSADDDSTWAWRRGLTWVFAMASLAGAASALAGVGFAPAGKQVAPGVVEKGDQLVLTPAKWVGHPLPILQLLGDQGEWLRTGEREIWVVDPNCRKCVATLALQQNPLLLAPASPPRAIVLIAPPMADSADAPGYLGEGVVLPMRRSGRIVCPVPTQLICRDGTVVHSTSP